MTLIIIKGYNVRKFIPFSGIKCKKEPCYKIAYFCYSIFKETFIIFKGPCYKIAYFCYSIFKETFIIFKNEY
jgi:hypothetical protein